MSIKKHIIVLTGAGISAQSGLKTFRDGDGLWMGYKVEDVATPEAFDKDPQLVLDFYNQRRKEVATALPNAAHKGLAEMEKDFDVTIITQNIDDLHERAGSTNIIHLHGEIFKMRSTANDHLFYDIRGDIQPGDTAADGAQLRPHIVWFGEAVPMMARAMTALHDASHFVVIGTSLQVYPAASLLQYVPQHVPKYIIDKKIPVAGNYPNMHLIEMPATDGVGELRKLLANFINRQPESFSKRVLP